MLDENALRDSMLAEMDYWIRPASRLERKLADELAMMTIISVFRPPSSSLRKLGMLGQKCHQNCLSFCRHTPSATAISGWWVKGDRESYVSHSVIRHDNALICVTPFVFEEQSINFIPDENITLHIGPIGVTGMRNGVPVELAVRRNPEKTMRQCSEMKTHLQSGMKASEAWRRVMGSQLE